MMEAFRKIVKVEENRLDLELPKDFTNGDYEVIVLPVKERTQNKKNLLITWELFLKKKHKSC